MELPKNQKKTARLLINEGLQRECRKHLEAVAQLLQYAESEEATPHDTYLKLFETVYTFDKHIARRYNNLGGSRYFPTVLALFSTGILTQEDISRFSEEVQLELLRIKKALEE